MTRPHYSTHLARSQSEIGNAYECDKLKHTIVKTGSSVFPTASWEQ